MALLVSGGHTELVYVSEAGDYKIVGETRDDAVGEAYDKVGRVMGLTYPAGREIDQLAHQGSDIYDFPRAMIKEDNLEFSFSGLKSAFINLHHNAEQKGESLSNANLWGQCRDDRLCQRQRVEQRKLCRLGPQCQTKPSL